MRLDRFFSREDRDAIALAAQRAEQRTSAELVPYVVEQSDAYESPLWKSTTGGALLGALAAGAIHFGGGFWGGHPLVWTTFPTILGALLGFLLAWFVSPIRRALIGPETRRERVERRAQAAFLDEQVFVTRERTGILLFVSLFERRIVVLGDTGINARVSPDAWDAIAETIVRGIRDRRPAAAICEALGQCAELLEQNGLARPRDDRNELPDDLRMRDR